MAGKSVAKAQPGLKARPPPAEIFANRSFSSLSFSRASSSSGPFADDADQ